MKTIFLSLSTLVLSLVCFQSFAQEDLNKENEVEEIIIKKKGGKDATLKIEMKDGKIMVNGKTLEEFNKGEDITVTKKKPSLGNDFGSMFPDNFMEQFGFGFDLQNLFQGKPNKKKVGRPFLGISTDEAANGVLITDVGAGSAADKAGLVKGDVIKSIDGEKMDNPIKYIEYIEKKKVGDEISIEILRNKKKKTVKATLEENKTMSDFSFSAPKKSERDLFDSPTIEKENPEWKSAKKPTQKLGLTVTDIKEGKGVEITEVQPESAAAAAGLLKGDILVELNGTVITNTDDARNVFQENKDEATYPVKIKRKNQEKTLTINFLKEKKTVDL